MGLSVDIEKSLGDFHLKIKLDVEGEVISLLGASGCGKSMTLKCIAGIETPDKGKIVLGDRVLFDSENHINLKPQERRVGYLFQQYALFPNMSVRNNIICGIRDDKEEDGKIIKVKRSRAEKKKIADDMISAMKLDGLEKKLPSQLSGGQQQRVALARILVNEPNALLLDEPFSALDAHLRFKMQQEVKEVIKDYGKPVLFVSHDRGEVYRLSDNVAIMDGGRVLNFGSKKDVFRDPVTVRGAVLTGISNISKINIIDEHTVYAADFGTNLTVEGNLEGITHVGVPSQHILYGSEFERFMNEGRATSNIIECDVIDIIEDPLNYSLTLRPSGAESGEIAVDVPKAVWKSEYAEHIQIFMIPDGIRLLKE